MYRNTMPQPPVPQDRDPRPVLPPAGRPAYRQPYPQAYPPPQPARSGSGLRQVPTAFWVGLVVGAGAFAVHVSVQQVSSGSGGYSCSYTDLAGFVATAVIGVCLIVGWVSRAGRHVGGRLAVPFMLAFSAALVALGVVHALRGNGTILSPCDARPLP